MILKLDENDFSHGLVATYENAARKAGFPVTDGSRYDCRHICVADNIQDTWIQYYNAWMREHFPNLSGIEITQNVMALLLLSGGKVDRNLKKNELSIDAGFIGK